MKSLSQELPLGKSLCQCESSLSLCGMEINESNYLPAVYEKSKDSLYSHTIFQVLADLMKKQFNRDLILDLGCADKRAFRLLKNYGAPISKYCGVDFNSQFAPDIQADIRDFEFYVNKIPFVPNAVLITDVLEHLEKGTPDIQKFLRSLSQIMDPDSEVYISIPQMYRLDRFKLNHLSYPEHKVRLDLSEWEDLIKQNFVIKQQMGIGYISVLPYLVMFFPFYNENGWTGAIFKWLRNELSKFTSLRKMDHFLSRIRKNKGLFCQFSNSVLFVCQRKD